MNGIKDKELWILVKNGDEVAFRVLYNRYHAQMYYIAKQYVKRTTLAEDAVQDTFIKLWEGRERIDCSKSVSGLLFVMLKNHLINTLRKKKIEIVSITAGDEASIPNTVKTDDAVLYKEYHNILERGLAELSERKREVFELRTMMGHTNSEVSELLQIDIKTVKTHYYLSSKFIRAYLKTHAGLLILFMLMS